MRTIWTAPFLSLLLSQTAVCQEVVPNAPLGQSETMATLPVFALRQLPVNQVIAPVADGDGWAMSPLVVAGSALSSKHAFLGQPGGYAGLLSTTEPITKVVGAWEVGYDEKAAAVFDTYRARSGKESRESKADWIASDYLNDITRKHGLISMVPTWKDRAVQFSEL